MTEITPDYSTYNAEDVLRELWWFMNIGCFNDVDTKEFDIEHYMNKIKNEITELQAAKIGMFLKNI